MRDVAIDTVIFSFQVLTFELVNWGSLSIILDKIDLDLDTQISTAKQQLRANIYYFIFDTTEESLKRKKKEIS